jgi:hypothetical protein
MERTTVHKRSWSLNNRRQEIRKRLISANNGHYYSCENPQIPFRYFFSFPGPFVCSISCSALTFHCPITISTEYEVLQYREIIHAQTTEYTITSYRRSIIMIQSKKREKRKFLLIVQINKPKTQLLRSDLVLERTFPWNNYLHDTRRSRTGKGALGVAL